MKMVKGGKFTGICRDVRGVRVSWGTLSAFIDAKCKKVGSLGEMTWTCNDHFPVKAEKL